MSVFKERLPWEVPESVWDGLLNMDVDAWDCISDLKTVQKALSTQLKYGRDLISEAFFGLFNDAMPLREKPPGGFETLHDIFQRAEDLSEWRNLRSQTNGDEVAAAFGASAFSEEIINLLPEETKEQMENIVKVQQTLNALRDQQAGIQGFLDEIDCRGKTNERVEETLEKINADIERQEKITSELLTKRRKSFEKNRAQIDSALLHGAVQSRVSIQQLREFAESTGLSWGKEQGKVQIRQLEGIEELANALKNSAALKEVMSELGWAKSMIQQQKRTSLCGREKFTRYKTEEFDLERLAPQEFGGLIADHAGMVYLDFIARLADGDLLHANYEGEEDEMGEGPIVFVSDTSGSMKGKRNAMRVAIELVMMTQARKQKRRFVSIPFSGPGEFRIFDPGNKSSPGEILNHLEFGYWGGTEPYKPMMAAFDIIKADPLMRQADICILTDGSFPSPPVEFMEAFKQVKEDPGVRISALVIGNSPGEAFFADRVRLAKDLLELREGFGTWLSMAF